MGEGTQLQEHIAERRAMSRHISLYYAFCIWFSFALFKMTTDFQLCLLLSLAIFFEALVMCEGPGGPPQGLSLFLEQTEK